MADVTGRFEGEGTGLPGGKQLNGGEEQGERQGSEGTSEEPPGGWTRRGKREHGYGENSPEGRESGEEAQGRGKRGHPKGTPVAVAVCAIDAPEAEREPGMAGDHTEVLEMGHDVSAEREHGGDQGGSEPVNAAPTQPGEAQQESGADVEKGKVFEGLVAKAVLAPGGGKERPGGRVKQGGLDVGDEREAAID